jgi:hypothetical protein
MMDAFIVEYKLADGPSKHVPLTDLNTATEIGASIFAKLNPIEIRVQHSGWTVATRDDIAARAAKRGWLPVKSGIKGSFGPNLW